MAKPGDEWRRMDRYYVQLYRDGQPQPYTICAVTVMGQLSYELWHERGKMRDRNSVCLGRGTDAAELKKLVD